MQRNRLNKVGTSKQSLNFIDADDDRKIEKNNNLRQNPQMSRFNEVFHKQGHAQRNPQFQGHNSIHGNPRHFSKIANDYDRDRVEYYEAQKGKEALSDEFKRLFTSVAEKEHWKSNKPVDLTQTEESEDVSQTNEFNFGDGVKKLKNSEYRSGALGFEYNRQTQLLGVPSPSDGMELFSGQQKIKQGQSLKERIENQKYEEQLRKMQDDLKNKRQESSFRANPSVDYGKRSEINLINQEAFFSNVKKKDKMLGDPEPNPLKQKTERDREAARFQQKQLEAKQRELEAEKLKQKTLKSQEEERKRLEEEKLREKQRREKERKLDLEKKKVRMQLQLVNEKNLRLEQLEKSEKIDIRSDLAVGIKSESIKYRTDVSFLLKTLLNAKYYDESVPKPQPVQIPDFFSSADHYFESFLPSFLEECESIIRESLNQFKKRRYNQSEGLDVSLNYLQHESDHFCEYEITDFSGSAADFIFRQNMAVLISNMEEPDVQQINIPSPQFCVIGILKEKGGETPNLITSTEYNKVLLSAIKNKDQRIKLFELTKLTSELREFLALKNIEFDPISKLIYQPKFIVSETTKKHDVDLYSQLFKQLRGKFNQGQMKAIQNISLMKQGIKLLQGPPGTGKTHTLIGIVSALSFYMRKSQQTSRKQILICTPSNYAIDEIILRLMNMGLYTDTSESYKPRIVRLGVTDKIKNPEVLKVCINALVEQETVARERQKQIEKAASNLNSKPDQEADASKSRFASMTDFELRQRSEELKAKISFAIQTQGQIAKTDALRIERDKVITEIIERKRAKRKQKNTKELIEEYILQNAEIICCTLNSSGSERLDRYERRFEAIIIDEAAQSTEPANIIPLRFKANKVILIGDPMQLPATTLGPNSIRTKYNRSLFERILNTGIRVEFLYTQYRMVPELRQFPSDEFYNGRLEDSDQMSKRIFPGDLAFLRNNNMLFLNVENSSQQKSGFSFYNQKEVTVCTTLINLFKAKIPGFCEKTMAIVSPYKEQVQQIRDNNHGLVQSGLLEVNTVDAFQGQEKDIIVFSCVRTNNSGIGFLSDIRRLNVAITRAKYALYIVGNAETLKVDKTWSNLLHHFNQQNKIFTLDNNQAFKNLIEGISDPSKQVCGSLNGRIQLIRTSPEINLLTKRAFDKLHEQKTDFDQSFVSVTEQLSQHYYDDAKEDGFASFGDQSSTSLKKLKTNKSSADFNTVDLLDNPYLDADQIGQGSPGTRTQKVTGTKGTHFRSPLNNQASKQNLEFVDSNPLSSKSASVYQSPLENAKVTQKSPALDPKNAPKAQYPLIQQPAKSGNKLSSLFSQKITDPPLNTMPKNPSNRSNLSSLINTPSTVSTITTVENRSKNPLQNLIKTSHPNHGVNSDKTKQNPPKKSGIDLEMFAEDSNFYAQLAGKKKIQEKSCQECRARATSNFLTLTGLKRLTNNLALQNLFPSFQKSRIIQSISRGNQKLGQKVDLPVSVSIRSVCEGFQTHACLVRSFGI